MTKILLVDDDIDFITQQEVQLRAAGYEVLIAHGVQEAMDLLQEQKADLAVVDLMMQHMDDGFVLSHQIKKTYPDMPVIILTGVASETGLEFDTSTQEERSWIKANAFLTKPVRFEQLRSEIDRLLSEK